jgi:hypothetical protein
MSEMSGVGEVTDGSDQRWVIGARYLKRIGLGSNEVVLHRTWGIISSEIALLAKHNPAPLYSEGYLLLFGVFFFKL